MGIIARQSIKASIVSLVGVAIGAFTRLFLYTKFLSTSEIGILETVVKMGILMTPFFIIGAPQVITRFFNRFKENSLNDGLIFTYSILIFLILVPVSSIIYLLSKGMIFSLYEQAPELHSYYILPLIVAITFGGFGFFRSISVVHLRITIPAFLSGVLDRVLVLILLLLFGVFHWINIDQFLYFNILIFFALPFILMMVYLVFVIKPKFIQTTWEQSKQILKKTAGYNSYLVLGTLSGVIISAIDVNMISGKLGTQLAGVYTIAFFMGTVIEIPRRSLTSIIYPILNNAMVQEDHIKLKKLYKKSSVNQFLVGSFIFMVIWMNVDQIFQIIPNGEEFMAGKLVVLFIGLSKLFDMMMGVNKQIIELSAYYRLNLFINVLLSVLVIVLNLIFIPLESEIFGGINGVAFASLLALVISNLIAFTIVWKKEKATPFNLNHLKILGIIGATGLIAHFIQLQNVWLSVIVTSILIAIIYVVLTLVLNVSEDFKELFDKTRTKFIGR